MATSTGSISTNSSNVSFARRSTGVVAPSTKGIALAKKRRAAAVAKSSQITLDTVLGLTCHSASSLCASESYVGYPAGRVAVLIDPRKKNKKRHIINKKPISCLALSPDGDYLAVGEYGHNPCAHVWDLKEKNPPPTSTLKGHTFGVKCITFVAGHKLLLTVGYQFDRQIILWNWKSGTQVAYGKFGQTMNFVAVSDDHSSKAGSNFFVTAHPRRVQYWYYELPDTSKQVKAPVGILKARSAILGDLADNYFVGVACGKGHLVTNVYALAKSGTLILFDKGRLVDKFTDIKASPAHSLAINENYLFCGCAKGVIRLFNPTTLDYIVTLPSTHPLGVDISVPVHVASSSDISLQYPDTVAMVIKNNKLSVVYNDHSFYIWDVSDIKQVGKVRSNLYHSSCVWDICTYPYLDDESKRLLPESSFVTCSSDNTIRFWCIEPVTDQWSIRNVYSKELIRVVYNDGIGSLKDSSKLPGSATAAADSSRGVRSITIHHNGQHLATGDREGNLKIYDMQFMDIIYEEVAHDSEILGLSYSKEVYGEHYLATASRDRMVHIFATNENHYHPFQSLPDHSASVTAVGFTGDQDRLQLLSCGADKSVIYHTLGREEDNQAAFSRSKHIATKSSIYDMAIDSLEKYFLIGGQDKFIRMYGVATGKKHTVIKVPTNEDGSIIKVTLDPSGLYAAASIGDKSVLVFDIYTGECIARIAGHSEVITQVKFSRDCRYLYTVSGDSCIFVWKLWPELSKTMHERLAEIHQHDLHSPHSLQEVDRKREDEGIALKRDQEKEAEQIVTLEDQPDFDFRLSMLPVWARKMAMSRPSVVPQADLLRVHSVESVTTDSPSNPRSVEGRWAERLSGSQMTFASMSLEDSNDEYSVEQNKPDSSMVVEDLDKAMPDSPDLDETINSLTKMPSEDSDAEPEGEMLYHPPSSHHLDVDPGIFSVTKPSKPEFEVYDDSEVEDATSPDQSPPLLPSPPRDKLFLEANYRSLERVSDEDDMRKLGAVSSRASISAKFFRKQSILQLLSPDVIHPDCHEPDDVEEEEEEGKEEEGKKGREELEPEGREEEEESKDEEEEPFPISHEQEQDIPTSLAMSLPVTDYADSDAAATLGTSVIPERQKGSKKERERKTSFEDAVSLTKKRLLNLGYNIVPPSDGSADEVVLDVSEPDGVRSKKKSSLIKKAKEIETKQLQATAESDLSSKAASALSNLESSFRALTILSAEAVKTSDIAAIRVISRGIISHKAKVISWSNHNRKVWKKKGRASGGGGGACPSGRDGESVPVGSGMMSLAHTLEPNELSQAMILVDQLKQILSNS